MGDGTPGTPFEFDNDRVDGELSLTGKYAPSTAVTPKSNAVPLPLPSLLRMPTVTEPVPTPTGDSMELRPPPLSRASRSISVG